MKSRWKEEAIANTRVVEIFASLRHAWQQEEWLVHHKIHDSAAEVAGQRAEVAEMEEEPARVKEMVKELRRELGERNEMVEFISRRIFGHGIGNENGKDWFGKFRASGEEEEEEEEEDEEEMMDESGYCLDENGGGVKGLCEEIGSGDVQIRS